MRVKAVVMDMDGTITRFNLDYLGARRRALQELEKMNLRTPEMTEELSIYLTLKQIKGRVSPETFQKLRSKLFNILEEMEVKAAQEVTLYPGVLETLQTLRGLGLKIGIATNNGHAGTRTIFKRYQLTAYFDAVVTRDDCEEMKPDSGPVRKVLNEMHIRPEEAVLVGDGVMDIIAAKSVGLVSVAVPTGPFSSGRLLKAEPDYFLGSVNDLPGLVEQLNATNPSPFS